MADPANLFEGAPAPAAPATPAAPAAPAAPAPAGNAYADLLSTIKNEAGAPKYDSVEKALEALKHAQDFIPTLKSELEKKDEELAALRVSKEKFDNLEAVVQRLTANPPNVEEIPPATRGLDEQAVSNLVKKTLAETEMTRKAMENLDKVQKALTEKFKDKAQEAIRQRAEELGVTPADLGELAKKSPALALQLFNTKLGNTPSVTTGSVTSSLQPTKEPPVGPPERSILSGASSAELRDYFSRVKSEVYKKHGID